MYDDLVKRLNVFRLKDDEYQFIPLYVSEIIGEAADAIEDMNKILDSAFADNERLRSATDDLIELLLTECDKHRWIPVTEQLPEIDEKHHCSKDILAYLKGDGMCFTALEENIFGQTWFECERHPALEEEMIVTHWMPLPEPPKEEA